MAVVAAVSAVGASAETGTTTTAPLTAPVPTTTSPAAATTLDTTTALTTTALTTTALTTAAPTTTAASGGTPCVGAGLLAVLPPSSDVPVAVGPSVAASERSATSAATAAEPSPGLAAVDVRVGAAGCRDATGAPGGTATRTGAWSLFGGALRGDSLAADLVPSTRAKGTGWRLRATIHNLRVDGLPVTPTPGVGTPVGDWGLLTTQARFDSGSSPLRWWAAALELQLTRARGGLPAGTTLLIGYASANRLYAPPPLPPAAPASTAATTSASAQTAADPGHQTELSRSKAHPAEVVRARLAGAGAKRAKHAVKAGQPLAQKPPLSRTTYDFPVFGQVSWGDSYGAARSDVPGGWHHGDDLFAALGRPVVAVADGTIFAVGWNGVGGWRLWLRDDDGNEFYYAHLAGYTALARNNATVKRGDVLGFVGNTGDAFTTPDHLHFEVHPVGLLYLGYDGAVDPSTYLARWQHAVHVASLPPVALPPGGAIHGDGALTDFRQLLELRPLRTRPRASKPALAMLPADRPVATRATASVIAVGAPARTVPNGGSTTLVAALASAGAAILALLVTFAGRQRGRWQPWRSWP